MNCVPPYYDSDKYILTKWFIGGKLELDKWFIESKPTEDFSRRHIEWVRKMKFAWLW